MKCCDGRWHAIAARHAAEGSAPPPPLFACRCSQHSGLVRTPRCCACGIKPYQPQPQAVWWREQIGDEPLWLRSSGDPCSPKQLSHCAGMLAPVGTAVPASATGLKRRQVVFALAAHQTAVLYALRYRRPRPRCTSASASAAQSIPAQRVRTKYLASTARDRKSDSSAATRRSTADLKPPCWIPRWRGLELLNTRHRNTLSQPRGRVEQAALSFDELATCHLADELQACSNPSSPAIPAQ